MFDEHIFVFYTCSKPSARGIKEVVLLNKVGLLEPGGFPRHFVFGRHSMQELSIFVDESGDAGEVSTYYLLTLVLHDQAIRIDSAIGPYSRDLSNRGLVDIPFHLGPLLNGHDAYQDLSISVRKQYLSCFRVLVNHLPFSYATLTYKKEQYKNDAQLLVEHMKRDLIELLFNNLAMLQSFDAIKVYYDNGQPVVTKALHDAIEYALCKNAIIYKDAQPTDYRLFQLADYICGLELTALKYADHDERPTDVRFFGAAGTFKKNYLKKIRRHRLVLS